MVLPQSIQKAIADHRLAGSKVVNASLADDGHDASQMDKKELKFIR